MWIRHGGRFISTLFPITERDAKPQLIRAVEENLATAGAYKLNGTTAAIIVFYLMSSTSTPFVFLNYIAVAQAARNLGLGRRLLNLLVNEIRQKILKEVRYTALVWEIEDPDDGKDAQEKQLRQRRLQFYSREGAQLFQHKFIQPPIDGVHCVPMRLMYLELESTSNFHAYEKEITQAIYFEKYAVVNQIQPTLLQNLLATLFWEKK